MRSNSDVIYFIFRNRERKSWFFGLIVSWCNFNSFLCCISMENFASFSKCCLCHSPWRRLFFVIKLYFITLLAMQQILIFNACNVHRSFIWSLHSFNWESTFIFSIKYKNEIYCLRSCICIMFKFLLIW